MQEGDRISVSTGEIRSHNPYTPGASPSHWSKREGKEHPSPVSLKLYRQEYLSHRAHQEYDLVFSGIDFSTEEEVRNISSVSSRVIEERQVYPLK